MLLSTDPIVHLGLKLNAGLDDIDGCESAVCDGALERNIQSAFALFERVWSSFASAKRGAQTTRSFT